MILRTPWQASELQAASRTLHLEEEIRAPEEGWSIDEDPEEYSYTPFPAPVRVKMDMHVRWRWKQNHHHLVQSIFLPQYAIRREKDLNTNRCTGLILSEMSWTDQVEARNLPIRSNSQALSQRLMSLDKPIAKTDISRQLDSRILRAQWLESFMHHFLPPCYALSE